jgi:hypothetical protein
MGGTLLQSRSFAKKHFMLLEIAWAVDVATLLHPSPPRANRAPTPQLPLLSQPVQLIVNKKPIVRELEQL